MLFKEFVQQHRVYRLVWNGKNLSLGVTSHQSGVDLFHFLGHEAKLRDGIGIEGFLVVEGDRFKREDRFARLVHWLDLILESLRRDDRAQVTAAIDYYSNATRHGCPANAGDKCGALICYVADANCV